MKNLFHVHVFFPPTAVVQQTGCCVIDNSFACNPGGGEIFHAAILPFISSEWQLHDKKSKLNDVCHVKRLIQMLPRWWFNRPCLFFPLTVQTLCYQAVMAVQSLHFVPHHRKKNTFQSQSVLQWLSAPWPPTETRWYTATSNHNNYWPLPGWPLASVGTAM